MFKSYLARWRDYLLLFVMVSMLVLSWYFVYQHYQFLAILSARDEPSINLKAAHSYAYLLSAVVSMGTIVGTAVILLQLRTSRQAAHATAERKLLLQAIEQAAQTVVVTDTTGIIVYANPALEQTTGYCVDKVVGQHVRILKSGRHSLEFYQHLWATITNGQVWRGRFINRRKDGRLYHEEATITPIKDAAGKITRYIAIKQDISTQISAQQEIERRARQSQTLLSIFADLTAELDPNVLYQRLVEHIVAILPDADSGFLLIKENDHLAFRGAVGHDLDILSHVRLTPGHLLVSSITPGQVARLESEAIEMHQRQHLDPKQLELMHQGVTDFTIALSAPIHIEGQFIGDLSVESHDNPAAFDALDEETLRLFAAQAGVVIRNAQLHDAEHRQRRQAEVLAEIAHILNASLDPTDVLNQTLAQLKRVIAYDSASIFLYENERQRVVASCGFPEDMLPDVLSINFAIESDALSRHIATTGQPVFIPDTLMDDRFDKPLPGTESIHSWLGVPLIFGERVIGYLCLDWHTYRDVTTDEIRLIQAIASQAATAIENARLFRDTARQVRELRALANASRIISSVLDQDQLLEELYEQITHIAAADTYQIALYDQATNIISLEITVDEGIRYPVEQYVLDRGLLQLVIHNRQPLRLHDLPEQVTELNVAPIVRASMKVERSWLAVPMVYRDKVVGAIVLGSYSQPGAYDKEHEQTLTSIANQAAVALENARLVAQLRQSETLHRSVVEAASHMDICIAIFQDMGDREGVAVFANEALSRLLGYSLQEIVDQMTFADIVHPDSLAMTTERYRARQRGEALPSRYELYLRHKNGTKILTEMSVIVLQYQGKPATIAIYSDVTQQRALEAQLRQAQKLEAVGTLAGGIAHDFNNLLTGVLGNLQFAQMELPPDSQPSRDLRSAERSARRAAQLTRQLLVFSRKSQTEQLVLANLTEVIDEVVALLRRTIDRRIEIVVHIAPDLWLVNADPNQISQVLMNLGLNARDAIMERLTTNCERPLTDRREVKLSIKAANVTLDEAYCQSHLDASPGDFVCLGVSDTGCGMDAGTRSRIFEPFFTTKEVGQGTGLGLAQAYGIVKSHGGFINFYSELGVGTVFRVYVPRARKKAMPRPADGGGPAAALPTGQETILVVDDEEGVRALGKRLLERQGYKVLLASDGQEALDVYRREQTRIDLVILDMTMPKLSGREVLQELLTLDPAAKVIIFSGYPAEEQSGDLLAAGAVAFVHKPYTLRSLAETVRRVLDGEEMASQG